VGDDGAPTVLNLVNVIARGSGGGPGVEVYSDGAVDSTANLSYTNAAAVKSTQAPSREHINGNATDQSPNAALPLFVDPAHGNFHEAPGAPTIDHGVNSAANGVHDVDGDARTVSGRTDIGADEFIPPPDTFTGVGIVTKRATVRKGRVRIAVTCPANAGGPLNGEPGSCTGELTLRTAHRVKASALTGARKKGKVLTLGTARFVLGAATTGRIRVHLSRKGRKLLKKRKTRRAVCTAVAHDGRGKVGTTSRHIKLKLAKKKKR